MTRENSGMQMALIIFVMLTVVLGVTSFIFFNQQQEATTTARISQQQSEKHQAEAQTLSEEIAELKRLIVGSETADLEDVRKNFEKDMAEYAATFPKQSRCYRTALARQQHTIGNANTELVSCKDNLQKQDDCIKSLEHTKTPQVKRHAEVAEAAKEELLARIAETKKRYKEMLVLYNSLSQRVQQIQSRADSQEINAKGRYSKLADAHEKLQQKYKILEAQHQRLLGKGEKIPQGRIVRVSSQLQTAWIDLGRADSLPRRTGFDVYPRSAFRLNPSTKKGEIEVTKILDGHLAEAYVVEDRISDPIIGGDKIHSQTWDLPNPRE